MDLTAEWDAWIASGDYTESLRSIAAGPDGTAYGVYFKGNVNGLIWYSPPQLEELGIAVPTTWDEFTAAMDAAAAADVRAARGRRGGRLAADAVERPAHPACRRRRGLQRPRPR